MGPAPRFGVDPAGRELRVGPVSIGSSTGRILASLRRRRRSFGIQKKFRRSMLVSLLRSLGL